MAALGSKAASTHGPLACAEVSRWRASCPAIGSLTCRLLISGRARGDGQLGAERRSPASMGGHAALLQLPDGNPADQLLRQHSALGAKAQLFDCHCARGADLGVRNLD